MAKRWPVVALNDVAPIRRRPVETAPGNNYPLLAVRSFGRGTFCKPPLEGDEITWQSLFQVRAGDLLLSNIKAWEGAVAVVANDDDGRYCSHRYITCVADETQVLSTFLGYYFRTPQAVWQLAKASPGSADRNRTLSMTALRRITVPLPPLDEQRRIVARLDQVERLMNARQAAIEAMDAEAEAMLRSAFDRLIDGAPLRPMAEVAPLVRRPVAVIPEDSYPELGVRSFGRGTFHKPPLSGAEVGSKKLFFIKPGDLLFNIVFAWEGAVAVAAESDEGRVGSHRFLTCIPHHGGATAEFLRFYFLTPEGLAKLGEASPGGAGRNRTLGLKALEAIKVPTPSFDRQLWFDGLQAKAGEMRSIREQAARDAGALLPAMLHEIFGGGEV
ncbi:Restriciton endonuclease subunit S [Magnetospirillum sp. LM-5]|uniref:restriction endonuclease subunit S n=1 Tax=Magnetospirillum sp. LM-5 TaxID=2681466 RepID=UPI001381FAC5|nr:restriction endonuclease subunit S [Magnetospirillum sp. LM-5]CAA7614662.1 Restriciton endonuclease subunit S [Magnetospirillum sp. LM-5]